MDSAITRRGFGQWIGGALAVGTGLAGTAAQAQGTITIAQAVDRIKAKLAAEGVAWRASNFDGFKTGDPNLTLTGIATCFQPTFNVLRRAAAAKKNFVVSHESCFWDGFDPLDVVKDDPVAKAKIRFVAENKMAVWRIHDHWHAHRPEPMGVGLARKLGWSAYWTDNVRPRYFTLPEMSLGEMALHVQMQLGTRLRASSGARRTFGAKTQRATRFEVASTKPLVPQPTGWQGPVLKAVAEVLTGVFSRGAPL